MNDTEKSKNYVEVLRTFSQVDIAMLKSHLDGNVEYYFKGENFLSLRPMLDPAVLMVREDFVEEVKELIKNFDIKFMSVSLNEFFKNDDEETI